MTDLNLLRTRYVINGKVDDPKQYCDLTLSAGKFGYYLEYVEILYHGDLISHQL